MQLIEDRTKRILIVEDEGLIAADVQKKLQRLGYPIPAVAQSGVEALRCARSAPFDLALMDIRLKGDMDGIATAQALKAEFEIPVVYMTAHADQDTIDRAKLTEPLGYILKPITDGDLRSVVQISLYRHEMERRLRTSEAWLSTTLRSVGDGIIATDTAGEIVFMNPVAEKLSGWSGTDGHGHLLMDILALFEESTDQPAKNPIFDLIPGESRCYQLIPRNGADTVVEVQCFENRLPAASTQPTPLVAGPEANGTVDELLGAIVVLRDTTARKHMEGRLVQSQRMEAVANMAGGLAHDFNNQLMVILGYSEELCARLEGEDKKAALEIKHAASTASANTGQLLMLSRRAEARFEVLNVNQVICELQPIISHNLGKSLTLVTDLGSPEGFVRGDRNQLRQVLLNLALNARDAMASSGELRIESSTVEIDPDSPEARLYRPGQFVRLRVADTGEGMDKAKLARIFEPFFSTKKAGFGAGLGLSIAHSIIVQSQGYIRAESEPGRGTAFEILLPCVGTFRGIGAAAGFACPDPEDATPTVLLVEDEDSVRRLMHKFLENEGYQLLEARNAEEAAAIAEVYPGPIHVLVADVLMPGMTGPELAARLMPLRPAMKTLFVSGYRHDVVQPRGLRSSDLNLLPKPFPAAELLRRVRMLLEQGTRLVQ
ncbi:MAG: response regulator [Candidatus Solibacter sp.]|nr:response regulator [Candidatus Solibacter sp.]